MDLGSWDLRDGDWMVVLLGDGGSGRETGIRETRIKERGDQGDVIKERGIRETRIKERGIKEMGDWIAGR